MGNVYYFVAERNKAVSHYEKAVALNPGLQTDRWLDFGYAMSNRGDDSLLHSIIQMETGQESEAAGEHQAAMDFYREAIDLDPSFPGAYNKIAWLSATCSDRSLRDADLAIRSALKACELTNNRCHTMLGTLAAAYAEMGQFDKATEFAEKALAISPVDSQEEYVFYVERYGEGLSWAPFGFEDDEAFDDEANELDE